MKTSDEGNLAKEAQTQGDQTKDQSQTAVSTGFYCHSELPLYPLGKTTKKKFVITFFLADNSLEVRDVRDTSESKGAGTFPKFLKRQRLPKTRTCNADSFPSMNAAVQQAYFAPEDFMIGRSVEILRQVFFIYDMDQFTRDFYRDVMGQQDLEPVPVDKLPPPVVPLQVPPHTGAAVGSLDDSLQNCLSLAPRQPKKDLRKMLDLAGRTLRFSAELDSVLPVDRYRRFILTYHLEDDSMAIFEAARANSGMRGGRFLERRRLQIPSSVTVDGRGPEYYSLADIYIGAKIHVFGRVFQLTGADEAVLKYIDESGVHLPARCRESIVEFLRSRENQVSLGNEESQKVKHMKVPVA